MWVKRFFPDIVVGVIGSLLYLALGKGVITNPLWWHSVIVGIVCAILYELHNICLGSRLSDLAVERISPILAASRKISTLEAYAMKLGEVDRIDAAIIDQVLGNHSELLKSRKYLMSFDGYLALLKKISDRYRSMVCVNRTLPINWLAPIHGKKLSTKDYEDHLRQRKEEGFKTYRLTIASKEEIFTQVKNTYKSLRDREEPPNRSVKWFLDFIQNLFDTDQDGMITKLSQYFDTQGSTVWDTLMAKPDHASVDSLWNKIKHICKNASESIQTEFIGSNDVCTKLNRYALEKFFAVHGRDGSYYMEVKNFREKLKNVMPQNDAAEYGEIAVYYGHGTPKMAIATSGHLGDLVCLEIVDPSAIAACINECIKIAEENKKAAFAGNFEDLIKNDV